MWRGARHTHGSLLTYLANTHGAADAPLTSKLVAHLSDDPKLVVKRHFRGGHDPLKIQIGQIKEVLSPL